MTQGISTFSCLSTQVVVSIHFHTANIYTISQLRLDPSFCLATCALKVSNHLRKKRENPNHTCKNRASLQKGKKASRNMGYHR
jgi:hypothetical protein